MGTETVGEPVEEPVPTAPEPARRASPAVVVALVLTAAISIGAIVLVGVIATRNHEPVTLQFDGRGPRSADGGPTRADHWHVALGVNDCGRWVPNWGWPAGMTACGGLARAGSGGSLYAGLHSHGDGLIHIEPLADDETGDNATLGRFFRYGGWTVAERAVTFIDVNEKNGNLCGGDPGVLRWAVNGKEMHGDPARYKLVDGDVVALVFTTADAPLPAPNAVPSYAALRELLGGDPQAV